MANTASIKFRDDIAVIKIPKGTRLSVIGNRRKDVPTVLRLPFVHRAVAEVIGSMAAPSGWKFSLRGVTFAVSPKDITIIPF